LIDYYEVLGVSPDSTPDQIKLAWREGARVHHPDRGGDKADFAKLAEAYEVLSNEQRRSAYTIAWRAAKSMTCPCGGTKLPGSEMCAWCGLRERQAREREAKEERRAQKRAEKERRREARRRASSGRGDSPSSEAHRSQTRGIGLPSADDLLQAVLAEAAMRSGMIDAGVGLDLRVNVDPRTGKVRLSGASVDALRAVKRNLEQADEVIHHLRRFRSD
jgi:curved DNA-binding protein CbpA